MLTPLPGADTTSELTLCQLEAKVTECRRRHAMTWHMGALHLQFADLDKAREPGFGNDLSV